jgi:hypothetical protein
MAHNITLWQKAAAHFSPEARQQRAQSHLASRFGDDHRSALNFLERKLLAPDPWPGAFAQKTARSLHAARSRLLAHEQAEKRALEFADYRRAVSSAVEISGPVAGAKLAISLVLESRSFELAMGAYTSAILASASAKSGEFAWQLSGYYVAASNLFTVPITGGQKDAFAAKFRAGTIAIQAYNVLSRSPDHLIQRQLGDAMYERARDVAEHDPEGAWTHFQRAAAHYKRAREFGREGQMLALAISCIDYAMASLPDRFAELRAWLPGAESYASRLLFEFGPNGRHRSARNRVAMDDALKDMQALGILLNSSEPQSHELMPRVLGVRSKLNIVMARLGEDGKAETADAVLKLSGMVDGLNSSMSQRLIGIAYTRRSLATRLANLMPDVRDEENAANALPAPAAEVAVEGKPKLVLMDNAKTGTQD